MQQPTEINWRGLFRRTGRSVAVLSLATAITLSATAGGQREQNAAPNAQDQGTRIDIQEGNSVDSGNGDAATESQGGQDQGGDTNAGNAQSDQQSQAVWALVDPPKDDQIIRNVSGIIQDGYVPVGMDDTGDAISVLYAKSNRVVFNRWIIQEFTDLDNLDRDFSEFLLNGWTPMDISVTDAGLSALFVKGDEDPGITGWRIHQVPVEELDSVFSIFEGYRQDGFLPYGVSIDHENNQFWFLMVQQDRPEGAEPARIAFNGFEEGSVRDGITADIENGLLPWGLARGERSTYVLYLF